MGRIKEWTEKSKINKAIFWAAVYLVFLCLVYITLSAIASAEEIGPGNSTTINCTNDTLGEYNITCTQCDVLNETECELLQNASICSINQMIDPGENFVLTGGVCDINIKADECSLADTGEVFFPIFLKVNQDDNGSLEISYEIYDHNNKLFESWSKPIDRTDVVKYEIKRDFTCPADLTTDVNIATCSKFLNTLLNTSDPVLFQLATGQSECTKALTSCEARVLTHDNISDYWQSQWEHCDSMFGVLDQEYKNARFELSDSSGACANNTKTCVDQFNTYKMETVPAFYMWTTYLLVFLLIAGGLFYIWENNKV